MIPFLTHRLEVLAEAPGRDSDAFLVEHRHRSEHMPRRTRLFPRRSRAAAGEEIFKRRLHRGAGGAGVPPAAEPGDRDRTPGEPETFDRCTSCSTTRPIGSALASGRRRNQLPPVLLHQRPGALHGSPDVFATHRLCSTCWSATNSTARIDHIDGLYDPTEYLWRLQAYVRSWHGGHTRSAAGGGRRWRRSRRRCLTAPAGHEAKADSPWKIEHDCSAGIYRRCWRQF